MINASSPIAMYYQLKEILVHEIQNGRWAPHTKMISEREIVETYNVSRVTARKAIELMVREGYVYKVKGKGTFVKGKYIEQPLNHFYSFREDLRNRGVETRSRMVRFLVTEADEFLANCLGVKPGDRLFQIERIFYAEELPYAKECSYIPCALCQGLDQEQVEKKGLYRSLEQFNIYPTRACERLKVIMLDQETAGCLEVSANDAAIYLTRATYCNDVIVEWNVSYVRGDMFVYSVELQQR